MKKMLLRISGIVFLVCSQQLQAEDISAKSAWVTLYSIQEIQNATNLFHTSPNPTRGELVLMLKGSGIISYDRGFGRESVSGNIILRVSEPVNPLITDSADAQSFSSGNANNALNQCSLIASVVRETKNLSSKSFQIKSGITSSLLLDDLGNGSYVGMLLMTNGGYKCSGYKFKD